MIQAAIFDMDGLLVDSEPHWRAMEREVFATVGLYLTDEECKLTTGMPIPTVIQYWYARRPWPQTPTTPTHEALDRAIASASPMSLIDVVVNRLGIRNALTLWHSATLEARNKPAPDVYLGTARKLNVRPANCLTFEDSGSGLLSASTAGMRTVAVPAAFEYDDPKFAIADVKISSLRDFTVTIFNILETIEHYS